MARKDTFYCDGEIVCLARISNEQSYLTFIASLFTFES